MKKIPISISFWLWSFVQLIIPWLKRKFESSQQSSQHISSQQWIIEWGVCVCVSEQMWFFHFKLIETRFDEQNRCKHVQNDMEIKKYLNNIIDRKKKFNLNFKAEVMLIWIQATTIEPFCEKIWIWMMIRLICGSC